MQGFDTRDEAVAAFKRMKAKLPGRWRMRVFDTGMWHYEAVRGLVGVNESYRGGYECTIEPPTWYGGGGCGMGLTIFGPRRSNPAAAVEAAFKAFDRQIKRLTDSRAKAAKVLLEVLGGHYEGRARLGSAARPSHSEQESYGKDLLGAEDDQAAEA